MHHASYIDTWIYFLIGFVFWGLTNRSTNKRSNEKYGQIAFLIIYLFAFFRYDFGNDYKSYWQMFIGNGQERKLEPISGAIIDLVSFLQFPPLGFIIFSTISLLCYRYVIKKYSSSQTLSWYFYFTFPPLFFQDCSTLRQAGAMGLFFVAFSFIQNRKYFVSFCLILLAISFHYSSVIGLLILLTSLFKKFSRKLNATLFILSFFVGKILERLVSILVIGSDNLFANKLEWYINADFSGNSTFQYVLYMFNLLNLLYWKELNKMDPYAKLYITLINIGFILYNVFQFETQTATRFMAFFVLFGTLLIPAYRDLLSMSLKRPISHAFLCSIMFLLQMILVSLYINAYNSRILDNPAYIPYQFWFNHI